MNCEGCGEPIASHQSKVYADEGVYHRGCEFEEVFEEVEA